MGLMGSVLLDSQYIQGKNCSYCRGRERIEGLIYLRPLKVQSWSSRELERGKILHGLPAEEREFQRERQGRESSLMSSHVLFEGFAVCLYI